MKRRLMVLSFAGILVMCGCASSGSPPDTTSVVLNTKSIDNDADFESLLGITINASYLPNVTSRQIIDDNIAEVAFSVKNKDRKNTNCTLRATRDESIEKSLSGIYDAALSAPKSESYSYTSIDGQNAMIDVTFTNAPTEGYDIYAWQYTDTFYCLSAKGALERDDFGELFGSVLTALGIAQ